ncbi:MAG: hypothetical protein LW870_00790 [Pirellula sp.]|nr:hypothetical protein [Pirellula sp.]
MGSRTTEDVLYDNMIKNMLRLFHFDYCGKKLLCKRLLSPATTVASPVATWIVRRLPIVWLRHDAFVFL